VVDRISVPSIATACRVDDRGFVPCVKTLLPEVEDVRIHYFERTGKVIFDITKTSKPRGGFLISHLLVDLFMTFAIGWKGFLLLRSERNPGCPS